MRIGFARGRASSCVFRVSGFEITRALIARMIRLKIHHDSRESINLKVPKLMAKCGLKTLYISTHGGNMRLKMMYVFIIGMQFNEGLHRSTQHHVLHH